jgi:hypothetical protein
MAADSPSPAKMLPDDRRAGHARHDLFEQFEPLCADAVFEREEPGGIAARPRALEPRRARFLIGNLNTQSSRRGRRRLEAGAAAEAAERVLEALLAEDPSLVCPPSSLLLVVGLLLRLQLPELVGEGEIAEHKRELFDVPMFEKLRIGNRQRLSDPSGAG